MNEQELRVCVTTVSMDVPRDSASKAADAERVLDFAEHFECDLVAFPGSFQLGTSEQEARAKVPPLIRAARARNMAIIFGIDWTRHAGLVAWAPGMKEAAIWDERSPSPRVLALGQRHVCILSSYQCEDAKLRREAAATRPELVVVCGHLTRDGRSLEAFRRLGLPVTASTNTFAPDLAPLVCPRGRRAPDISSMQGGLMVAMYAIDDRDGPIAAVEWLH